MQSLENDFAFLRAAVGDLQDYLLSAQLYWRLLANPTDRRAGELLQLTPGNLLLCQRRLTACAWDSGRQQELDQLVQQSAAILAQWKAHLLVKARQEAHARLEQWSTYLQEISGGVGKGQAGYPFQVRSRVILGLLEMVSDPNDRLGQDDELLKRLTETGPYVWEAETAAGFASAEFWYLYVRIRN
jgi:hypothetical protein